MQTLTQETTADSLAEDDPTRIYLASFAHEASNLLKVLGHEGRLRILYHLSDGAKSVTELKDTLPGSQSLVSSHLARLRYEGLVSFRKEGKTCVYFLRDNKTREILNLIDTMFCDGLLNHIQGRS